MEREGIEKAFGERAVPEVLLQLCEFDEAKDGSFSGDFELSDTAPDYVDAWFQGDEALTSHFIGFGIDGAQSPFALWLKDDTVTAENAPVVFLDGEFEGTRVLASNIKDFLGLLALNVDGLGYVEDWNLAAANKSTKKAPLAYRAWLKENVGIEAPADPVNAVRLARARHPDVKAWISARLAE